MKNYCTLSINLKQKKKSFFPQKDTSLEKKFQVDVPLRSPYIKTNATPRVKYSLLRYKKTNPAKKSKKFYILTKKINFT